MSWRRRHALWAWASSGAPPWGPHISQLGPRRPGRLGGLSWEALDRPPRPSPFKAEPTEICRTRASGPAGIRPCSPRARGGLWKAPLTPEKKSNPSSPSYMLGAR